MRPFKYTTAATATAAVKIMKDTPNSKLLAGGTNLVDLMKEDVERPAVLVDINNTHLNEIKSLPGKGLSVGSLCTNAETANNELVRTAYPLLTQAILSGATAQIRNMATNGGNLNQRTRCPYFYEVSMPCNKRNPGSGCAALQGENRTHAILGWSQNCVATNPSDMCVALAALDAVVKTQNPNGKTRSIPFPSYHRLPGELPQKDNNLELNEMVTSIEIPANNFANNSYYLKVRDRSSYAFALVSVAAALELQGNAIKQVRIALGGVAHKPWRATLAEKYLTGKVASEANFNAAAAAEMKLAKPLEHNQFKVELATKAITRALMRSMNGGKDV